jgi:hypothetical protein
MPASGLSQDGKMPGIFIQAPIYMISEKAADVMLNGAV